MTRGTTKPFDQKLHDENDPEGRKIVMDAFAQMGVPLTENPDKRKIDLLGEEYNVEVERRSSRNWNSGKFTYSTVHVLCRKEKYQESGKFVFAVLSHNKKHIGLLGTKKMKHYMADEYVKEIPNRLVPEGEKAFDVPREELHWIRHNGEKWVHVN